METNKKRQVTIIDEFLDNEQAKIVENHEEKTKVLRDCSDRILI